MVAGKEGLPVIEAACCLNQRHTAAGCVRCADACPVNAITTTGDAPALIEEMCVGCGACVAACPTDAVASMPPIPERSVVAMRRTLGRGAVAVVCPEWDGSAMAAEATAVVTCGRCLASLDLSDLTALTLDGSEDLWLDDSACANCPIGAVHSFISAQASAVSTLLDALGLPARVRRVTESDAIPLAAPVLKGTERVVSRRTLLRRLAGLDRDPTRARDYPRYDRDARRMATRIPRRRHRLDGWLAAREMIDGNAVDTTSLPYADIQVNEESCSACGLCAMFCPTGALVLAEDTTEFALAFRPSLCLDCGICTAACPEGAVAAVQQLPVQDLIAGPTRLLAAGALGACSDCGVGTTVHPDEETRCSPCRHGHGAVKPLHDGAELLDGLLRATRHELRN